MFSRLRQWLRPDVVLDQSQVLRLRPGDYLVLRSSERLTPEQLAHVKSMVQPLARLTGAKVVFLDRELQLTVEPDPAYRYRLVPELR